MEGSVVWLDVSGLHELECVTLGFVGSTVVLLPRHALPSDVQAGLADGTSSAELLVENGNYVQSFPCRARAKDAAIMVEINDGVHVSQRRSYSRAEISIDARLVASGRPGAFETTTVDLSGGGVRVRRPVGLPVWPSYEITLTSPLLRIDVVADAAPMRVEDDFLGLHFTRIAPATRQLLVELVLRALSGQGGPEDAAKPAEPAGSH